MKIGNLKLEVRYHHLFTIVLMLFIQSTYCQSYDKNGRKYFESKNVGSAKEISGSTYILSIFASEGDEKWTVEGKKRFIKKERDAYDWIAKQVKTYNKTFNYKRGLYYKDDVDFKLKKRVKVSTSDSIIYFRDNINPMVLEALQAQGFKSVKSFYNYITSKYACTNVFINLYIAGQGHSYCQPFNTTSDSSCFIEVTVICEKNKYNVETYTAALVHESLHIFGAWDLYAVTPAGKQNEEMAKKKFPNSIMLKTQSDINQLSIDEVTAWRIGLIEKKIGILILFPLIIFTQIERFYPKITQSTKKL